jgi:hypothetical protein
MVAAKFFEDRGIYIEGIVYFYGFLAIRLYVNAQYVIDMMHCFSLNIGYKKCVVD